MSTDDHLYLIEQLANEFFAGQQKGEGTSISQFVAKHPEYADELRDFIEGVQLVNGFQQEQKQSVPPVSLAGTKFGDFPKIDDYRIIRELGRGAMGVVYEAEQLSLSRRVALKTMLHTGDEQGKLRFQHEARTAARLHHPGIVPVYDVGEVDGMMYYAMQFIDGRGLDRIARSVDELLRSNTQNSTSVEEELADWLVSGTHDTPDNDSRTRRSSESSLDTNERTASTTSSNAGRQRNVKPKSSGAFSRRSRSLSGRYKQYHRSIARIGWHVADAMAFAHDQNVIHRDIKPANLLLDTSGEVWVADFGLVKTDDVGLTQTGAFVGTLRYMAPERFQGDCDKRSDVYSLGMTLYELLALRPALDSPDQMSLLNQIRDTEPPPLRAIEHRVPRDLDVIVMRAIQKEPHRRYSTARHFADDLDNFLNGRPIQARHVSSVEKTLIWARRKPVVAGLLSLLVVGLLVTMISSVYAAFAFRDIASVATIATKKVETTLARSNYFLSWARWEDNRADEANEYLERVPPEHRNIEWAVAKRYFQGGYSVVRPSTKPLSCVRFTPDGESVVAIGEEKKIFILDSTTGLLIRQIPTELKDAEFLSISSDGRMVAAGGKDGRVTLWEIESGTRIWSCREKKRSVKALQFSPDGKYLAVVSKNGEVTLLDTLRGETIWAIRGHTNDANGIAFHPGGKHLVTVGTDEFIRFWSVANGNALGSFKCQVGKSVVYRPNGKEIAVGFRSGVIKRFFVRDASTAGAFTQDTVEKTRKPEGSASIVLTEKGTLRGHTSLVYQLAFCPDGARLVSSSRDSTVRIWQVDSGVELKKLQGHYSAVVSVDVATDGFRVVSCASKDIRFWDGRSSGPQATYLGHRAKVVSLEFSDDGQEILSASDTEIHLWNPYTLENIRTFKWSEKTNQARFAPDGQYVIACSHEGQIKSWDRNDGREIGSFVRGNDNIAQMDFSPGGKLLAIADEREATLLDITRLTDVSEERVGKRRRQQLTPHPAIVRRISDFDKDVTSVAFNPLEPTLAIGDRSGLVSYFNVDTGDLIWRIRSKLIRINSIEFDGDGKRFFCIGSRLQLRETKTGDLIREFVGHQGEVRGLAITSDGSRIATGGADRTVRIWDANTGAELCKLDVGASIQVIRFSPDGTLLVAGHRDGVSIWDITFEIKSQIAAVKQQMVRSPHPVWHAKRSSVGRESQDWYAAVVHRVRQLSADPDSVAVQVRTCIAASMLHKTQPDMAEYLPAFVRECDEVRMALNAQRLDIPVDWASEIQSDLLQRSAAPDRLPFVEIEFELMKSVNEAHPTLLNMRTFALLCYRMGRFELAIKTLEPVSDKIPFDLNVVALSTFELGHQQQAIDIRRRARLMIRASGDSSDMATENKQLRKESNDVFDVPD